MTSAREREQDYLSRLLQLNPLGQTGEILARRDHFLNPESSARPFLDDQDLHFVDRKQQVRRQLETIRNNFWQLEVHALQTQLAALDVDEFPDLGFAVSRLQQVAKLKSSFQVLQHHHACFDDFYNQFTRLVIAAPDEAEQLRTLNQEATDFELADLDMHTTRDYRRIAEVIQKEFPELYELEKYWLNQVAAAGNQQSSINRTVHILHFLIVACLVLVLLLGLKSLPEITLIITLGLAILFGASRLTRRFVERNRSAA